MSTSSRCSCPNPNTMQPATSMLHIFWKLPYNHVGWLETSEISLKQPYKVAPGWCHRANESQHVNTLSASLCLSLLCGCCLVSWKPVCRGKQLFKSPQPLPVLLLSYMKPVSKPLPFLKPSRSIPRIPAMLGSKNRLFRTRASQPDTTNDAESFLLVEVN